MGSNIVYITAVSNGDLPEEYQYSIQSWKHWCDVHGHELFVLDQPVVPMNQMHIIWQRYFMFDIFDANDIEFNQVLLVDADTIVHPECPNFFEETDNKYCLVHDDGSYDWILRGMEHYINSGVFSKSEWFPFWQYGNSGFQIVNNTHRSFFTEMRNLYETNQYDIRIIQDQFGIGTDQTPLNFMLRRHRVDVKLLPYKYNMLCMPKKEIFTEGLDFIDYGWVYHFNGLPNKKQTVPYFMKKTFERLYT